MLTILKPFLTPSHRLDAERFEQKRRYSFSYLQMTGCLDSNRMGFIRLVRCAVRTDVRHNPWANLVVQGRVLPDRWNQRERAFAQHAQNLLRKYGRAFVALRLLQP